VRTQDFIAVFVSLCLLGGAGVESWSSRPPPDASVYHAMCRDAAAKLPRTIGDWVSRDYDPTPDTIRLLRPNVLISREYTNTITGAHVSLLIVQCDDARNLTSHYPPICYPTSRGMEQIGAQQRQWSIGGQVITGTEYEFRSANFGPGTCVIVQNFILQPNGEIVPDMEPVKKQALARNRYYGAGQVQLVFDSQVPSDLRDAEFAELIEGCRPLIDTVLNGRKAVHE
jgi:hypothetical protein